MAQTSVSASVTTRKEGLKFNPPLTKVLPTSTRWEIVSLEFLLKEARASFWPPETAHKQEGTFETRHSIQKGTWRTHCDKIEEKDANRPAQSTETCHTSFSLVPSHHNRLLGCHGPFTVRGEHSCRDSRPLGSITQPPGLMHFLCGSPMPPLPTPYPGGKERSCHKAQTTR